MQVRLVTTVETIIEIDPENTVKFDTAKAEIYGRYEKEVAQDYEQDQLIEGVKSLQHGVVIHDRVLVQTVTHDLTEVDCNE